MKKNDKVQGHGFDVHPENINRKGQLNGKRKDLTDMLRNLMDEDGFLFADDIIELDDLGNETGNIVKHGKIKIPKKQAILLSLMRKAAKGGTREVEFIFERLEGKVPQPQQFSGEITTVSKGFWDYYLDAQKEVTTSEKVTNDKTR